MKYFLCILSLFAVVLSCPLAYCFHLCRYSYPFFGSPYPVLVQPPVRVAPNTEATFTQGYCAFDFATTPQQLHTQFCSVPLVVEVWEAQDQLVGVARVRQNSCRGTLYFLSPFPPSLLHTSSNDVLKNQPSLFSFPSHMHRSH